MPGASLSAPASNRPTSIQRFSSANSDLEQATAIEQVGYVWLFVVGFLFIIRLLLDPLMVRRPLLEPNLSVGGMTFIGTSLLVFLMANVINSKLTADDLAGAKKAQQVTQLQSSSPEDTSLAKHGPGYPLLHLLPVISTQILVEKEPARQTPQERMRSGPRCKT